MWISVKKIVTLSVIIFWLFFSGVTSAQDLPDEIEGNPLYSNAKDIINGAKWTFEKKYLGIPFVAGSSWVIGDVTYNGEDFKGVHLNFDLFTNEFIIFDPEEGKKKFVVLPNGLLESFSFQDSIANKKRYFEYSQLPGTTERSLYEVAYNGNTRFLIRHKMTVSKRIADGFLGYYYGSFDYYLKVGDQYKIFSKKNSLLKILGKHSVELKKFIRRNNLTISKRYYDDIDQLLEYFDRLEVQNPSALNKNKLQK